MQVRARISVQEKRHSVHRFGRERAGSHDGKFAHLNKQGTHEHSISPLAQSGTRSPISDSEVSSVAGSEPSSRTTSATVLPEMDKLHHPHVSSLGSADGDKEEGGVVGGAGIGEDRQPVAIHPQSPKHSRKPLQLDSIAEGDEPEMAVPAVRRPRSETEPGE